MKRMVLASALALVFMIALYGGEAGSKNYPEGYVAPWQTESDDHTWGGENGVSGDTGGGDRTTFLRTGFLPLDIFYNSIMLKRLCVLGRRAKKQPATRPLVQPQSENNVNPGNQVTSNNRGN